MFDVIQFSPAHAKELLSRLHASQRADADALAEFGADEWGFIQKLRTAWTLRDAAQDVVACAGVLKIWEGRAVAWAMFDHELGGTGMLRVTREIRKKLDELDFRRIEATAITSFPPAARFLEMLGFHAEGVMLKYGSDGSDHILFARVK